MLTIPRSKHCFDLSHRFLPEIEDRDSRAVGPQALERLILEDTILAQDFNNRGTQGPRVAVLDVEGDPTLSAGPKVP
jgi:hypothetical protein